MAAVDTDWQAQRDVLSSNRYMLENHLGCDVTFYVGKKRQKVTAHKYVLMSRSSVLYTMLCGPLEETGPINIPDIEPEVFEELLRFIYYEAFEPNEKSILPLLYAAKKYAVKSLVNRSKERVCLDNVCVVLQQAHAYNEQDLVIKCLEVIMDNGSSVLKHPSFVNLSSECVEMVLKQDELWAKEEEVYEAMKKWAGNECARRNIQPSNENMRRVLGGLKNLIRFSVMDEQYFADKVAAEDILTSDEKVQFFRSFCAGRNRHAKRFEHTTREPRFHLEERVLRFPTRNSTFTSHSSGLDAIEFRCSDSVLLSGFLIFGASNRFCKAPYNEDIEVQLLDESKHSIISLSRNITICDDKLLEILFDTRFYLQRSWYTITLRRSSLGTTQCGQDVHGVERLNNGQFIEFRGSSLSRDCTNVSTGQIPGLLICRRRLKK